MAARSKIPSKIKRPRHNFHSFPCLMNWGKQQYVRYLIPASPGGVGVGVGDGDGDGDGTSNQPSVSPETKPSSTETPSKSSADSVNKSELVNAEERLGVSRAEAKDTARPGKLRSSNTVVEWSDPSLPRRISEGEKRRRTPWKVEFPAVLSKEEVEEDFMKILGRKPPSKPKNKRPRKVQETVDKLFPGMPLKMVTSNSFKVRRR